MLTFSFYWTQIKREVTIWQAAVHENILPFIGYQIVDGDAMLVSPWCENGNLGRFIRIHPDLSDVTKLRLVSLRLRENQGAEAEIWCNS